MKFLNDILNINLPELAIILTIMVQILMTMFSPAKHFKVSKWISVFAIVLAITLCSEVQVEPLYYGFSGALVSDNFTTFFKALILLASLFLILLTKKTIAQNPSRAFQFNAIYLTAILGSLILVSANDFLTVFVALETLAVSTFFLISFEKGYKAKEATFKYLIMNSLASAVFLFGVSYLYGLSGTLSLSENYEFFSANPPTLIYTIASIFIICGIIFKLGLAPFANWILDIYEGTNTAIVAFLAVVPELAIFGIVSRLLVFSLGFSFMLTMVLIVLAVITVVWANFLALRQKNIKRLLACSSAANVAYVIFALALVSVYNLSTVLFYLVTYIFMNIGVFATIIILENSNFTDKLYEFKNIAYSNPYLTSCFAVCLIGLAGFPFTSGFIAKLYLFSAIARSGLLFLPFLAVVLCMIVVAAFYYLNIVKLMFEKTDKQAITISYRTSSAVVILWTCAIITVLLGVFPSKVIELCQFMAYNI